MVFESFISTPVLAVPHSVRRLNRQTESRAQINNPSQCSVLGKNKKNSTEQLGIKVKEVRIIIITKNENTANPCHKHHVEDEADRALMIAVNATAMNRAHTSA